MNSLHRYVAFLLAAEIVIAPVGAMADQKAAQEPLTIQEQGSFAVGGTVLSTPGTYNNNAPTAEGQTLHGDHLYAFYQIPQNPKALPIVMLHGAYQSARSWETTPDGREGFQNIFLRRGFPVYLIDQPRRGRAGNSTMATTVEPTPYDQLFFDQFRLGKWPNFFDNVQFDRKPETLDQFFRSVTPNTGPYDAGVISDAMSALIDRPGPSTRFAASSLSSRAAASSSRKANFPRRCRVQPAR
jgi:pimeloyl-ACP methyl ester carboxylesterase